MKDPRPGIGHNAAARARLGQARAPAGTQAPAAGHGRVHRRRRHRASDERGGPRVACCRRAWIDAYADRVERMMRTYMRRKRRPVYWLTLPAPRQPERRTQFLAINYAIAQAARKAGGKAHVVDTVPVLSPNNEFHRKRALPRPVGRRARRRRRAPDDRGRAHGARPRGARDARGTACSGAPRRRGRTRPRRTSSTSRRSASSTSPPHTRSSVEAGRGQSNRIAVAEDAGGYTVDRRGRDRCSPAAGARPPRRARCAARPRAR